MSEIQIIETAAENEIKAAEGEVVHFADKVETEAAKIESEIVAAVETDVIAPVENFLAAAEAEVVKVYERIVHPEIGQTRPVINTTLPHGGGSVIKNPS